MIGRMPEFIFLYIFVLVTFAICSSVYSQELGMKCTSHPAYSDDIEGVLMRSWSYKVRPKYTRSIYKPRYENKTYAPVSDLTSTKYLGLDLFIPGGTGKNDTNPDSVTVSLQRPAKLYLMLRASRGGGFPSMILNGWQSEGWAEMISGSVTEKDNLSIMGTLSFRPSRFAYVFSKLSTNDQVQLPGAKYIIENSAGANTTGSYWILIAESDGGNSSAPLSPEGVGPIPHGGRCPEELHQLWLAPVRPGEDDVAGERFSTCHPMWDPCYFCAYDHEHCSCPIETMGYYPRLNYTAWKNYNQDESHNGFKVSSTSFTIQTETNFFVLFAQGFMFQKEDVLFYYSLHAHLTESRRFTARSHTQVFVAMNATTKDKILELSHKGDFGFAAAQYVSGKQEPINEEDIVIKVEGTKGRRRFNVINQQNLNTSYSYRNGTGFLKGRYEKWRSIPMCSTGSVAEVDIKDPATGLKMAGSSEMIILGRVRKSDRNKPREEHVVVKQSRNMNIDFKAKGFTISAESCEFELPDSSGEFFTTPNGTVLEAGPGLSNVRQFIDGSFSITLKGRYQALDPWVGMYVPAKASKLEDIGMAIDPAVN